MPRSRKRRRFSPAPAAIAYGASKGERFPPFGAVATVCRHSATHQITELGLISNVAAAHSKRLRVSTARTTHSRRSCKIRL
jgi:hypothetical protein